MCFELKGKDVLCSSGDVLKKNPIEGQFMATLVCPVILSHVHFSHVLPPSSHIGVTVSSIGDVVPATRQTNAMQL